jgi:hypothetical protein
VTALQAELDAVEKEEEILTQKDKEREKQEKADRDTLAKSRGSR